MTRPLLGVALCAFASACVACGSQSGSPATRFGTILLESDTAPEPLQIAAGLFYRYDSTPVADPCFVAEELGDCRFWQCDNYTPASPVNIVRVSAGTVGVTGTKAALSFQQAEPGTYTWDDTQHVPLWDGGERLLATVDGSADFPGLSSSLLAPDPITLSAPAVPAEPWQVDASKDLAFAWSGATNSNVYVEISVAVANPDGGTNLLFPSVDCGFLGTRGASVVPAAALAKLAKPSGILGHQIEALTFAANSVRVDDAVLTFRATSFALSALATIE